MVDGRFPEFGKQDLAKSTFLLVLGSGPLIRFLEEIIEILTRLKLGGKVRSEQEMTNILTTCIVGSLLYALAGRRHARQGPEALYVRSLQRKRERTKTSSSASDLKRIAPDFKAGD